MISSFLAEFYAQEAIFVYPKDATVGAHALGVTENS